MSNSYRSYRIDVFLEFFRKALGNVNNYYYNSHLWIEQRLNDQLPEGKKKYRNEIEDYLYGYGERVFCYELYHQVRLLMKKVDESEPEMFRDVLFQGELKKDDIDKIIESYDNVKSLKHRYIPDFILHSPGNFECQDIVIEVKSNPELTFSHIKDDLLKIHEFISSYTYKRGVFLTINNEPDKMHKMLTKSDNVEWIKQCLPKRENILFMCKQQNDKQLFERNLHELNQVTG